MKKYLSFVAASLLASTMTMAASGDFTKLDANADGMLTLEEGMAMHKDWTADAFKKFDTNADGMLDSAEYEAAMAAGRATKPADPNAAQQPAQPADPNAAQQQPADPNAPAAGETTTTANPPAAPADGTQAATGPRLGPATYLTAVGEQDVMASSLIGMRVYAVAEDVDPGRNYPADARANWSDIGEVNDVVLDWNGDVRAVVLGVGGFLGIGEKNVAIEMTSLRRVRESADANDWFLVVNASKDTLNQAPTFSTATRS